MSRWNASSIALIASLLAPAPLRAQLVAPAAGGPAAPAMTTTTTTTTPVQPPAEPTVPAASAPAPSVPAQAPPPAAAPSVPVRAAAAPTAAVPRSVRVVHPPCPLYDAGELDGVLRTELSVIGIDEVVMGEAEPAAASLVQHLALLRVACADAPDTVTVQLADFASGKALEREVLVGGVEPKARPRLIAMTAAGLTESSWIQLAVDPSVGRIALPAAVRDALRLRIRDALFPAQPERVAPVPPAPRESAGAPPPALSTMQLMGVVRSFPARSTGLAGIGIGAARRLGSGLRGWADLDVQLGAYELSDATGRIGSMRLSWIAAGLGIGWVSTSVPSVAVGPFLRAGLGAASAELNADAGVAPADSNGFICIAGLRAELDAPLSRLWSVLVAIEGGYTLAGVVFVTPQQRSAGMAEAALALRLGLALAL